MDIRVVELRNKEQARLIKFVVMSIWPLVLLFAAAGFAIFHLLPIKTMLYPSAQVNVPFQVGVKGAVVTVEFDASLPKGYVFYLELHHRPGDNTDRKRVALLVNSPATWPDGTPARRAPPVPVRLIVTRLNTGNSDIVLDETFTHHRLSGLGNDYFSETITSAHLDPGHYQARIEALADIPALQDVAVRFDLHVPGHPH